MQKSEFDTIIKELSTRKEFLEVLSNTDKEICTAYKIGMYNTSTIHSLDEVELGMLKGYNRKIVKQLTEEMAEVIGELN